MFGGSYGGLVAQVFVRRHPGRSAGMILSHTLLPSRESADAIAGTVRWLPLLPAPVLRALFRKRVQALFAQPGDPQVALSKALFDEIVAERLSKAQLISMLRRVVDAGQTYAFTPRDLEAWPGRSLLLMADDDPATPPAVRAALVAMYPRAQVRLFSGSGHMTAVLKQDEYFAAIDEFLGPHPPAPSPSALAQGEGSKGRLTRRA
jgi:pimeloyl-ACP methyl ester carboxylesterase